MDRPPAPAFAGIDVSKDRLDVHLRPSVQSFAAPRDGPGLEQLLARLRDVAPALVVLEATGGWECREFCVRPGAAGRLNDMVRPEPW